MEQTDGDYILVRVTPREGRVSRNFCQHRAFHDICVTPREGRVSRNCSQAVRALLLQVTPREGRVSRNHPINRRLITVFSHAPRGACE